MREPGKWADLHVWASRSDLHANAKNGGVFAPMYICGMAELTISGIVCTRKPKSCDSGEFALSWSGMLEVK